MHEEGKRMINRLKWVFMSKYKKLLYQIKCAQSNGQRLHLSNGVILDFTSNNSNEHDTKNCKTCKFWNIREGNDPNSLYFCTKDEMWCMPLRKADDYCNYWAERKDVKN